jgi:hypothetical protein
MAKASHAGTRIAAVTERQAVGDEGQEFRAGALAVTRAEVMDGLDIPLVGLEPDSQLHLRELLEAGADHNPERVISTRARWAIFGTHGTPALARLDVLVDRPRDFELRLMFDLRLHRASLDGAVRTRRLALVAADVFEQRRRLDPPALLMRSFVVSDVPSDVLRQALASL